MKLIEKSVRVHYYSPEIDRVTRQAGDTKLKNQEESTRSAAPKLVSIEDISGRADWDEVIRHIIHQQQGRTLFAGDPLLILSKVCD